MSSRSYLIKFGILTSVGVLIVVGTLFKVGGLEAGRLLLAEDMSARNMEPKDLKSPDETVFDDAKTYVPPEELPVKDRDDKDELALSPEERAALSEGMTVTPEGEISTLPFVPEDISPPQGPGTEEGKFDPSETGNLPEKMGK
jgi:hypothetical protein